jgi:hypothetical protein
LQTIPRARLIRHRRPQGPYFRGIPRRWKGTRGVTAGSNR